MTRSDLEKRIAEAISPEKFLAVPSDQRNLTRARAALEAIEAAGVELVPKDPTIKMFFALVPWLKDAPDEHPAKLEFAKWVIGSFPDDYRSMLAASPFAPPLPSRTEEAQRSEADEISPIGEGQPDTSSSFAKPEESPNA